MMSLEENLLNAHILAVFIQSVLEAIDCTVGSVLRLTHSAMRLDGMCWSG